MSTLQIIDTLQVQVSGSNSNKLTCVGGCHNMPHPLQVDLFDLESGVRVTCDVGYSVPILVFLGLPILDLDPMYVTGRRQTHIIA